MVVAEDETIRQDWIDYIENYIFKVNNFPSNWTAEGFATKDEGDAAY